MYLLASQQLHTIPFSSAQATFVAERQVIMFLIIEHVRVTSKHTFIMDFNFDARQPFSFFLDALTENLESEFILESESSG